MNKLMEERIARGWTYRASGVLHKSGYTVVRQINWEEPDGPEWVVRAPGVSIVHITTFMLVDEAMDFVEATSMLKEGVP